MCGVPAVLFAIIKFMYIMAASRKISPGESGGINEENQAGKYQARKHQRGGGEGAGGVSGVAAAAIIIA